MQLCTRRLSVTAVVAGMVFWAFIATAQTPDPAIGTWTLNAGKSKFNPGPPPTSITVTFEAAGQGIHVVANTVDATGATVRTEYTGNYDGKDYPLRGVPVADMVSLKRIDATTTQRTDKKAGKVVQTYVRKVSADGKAMTVTQTGTDADGKALNNTLVLDKK